MTTEAQNIESRKMATEAQNIKYRKFVIAQLQAVRDEEQASRVASHKEHLKKEIEASLLDGGRDWSKQ